MNSLPKGYMVIETPSNIQFFRLCKVCLIAICRGQHRQNHIPFVNLLITQYHIFACVPRRRREDRTIVAQKLFYGYWYQTEVSFQALQLCGSVKQHQHSITNQI